MRLVCLHVLKHIQCTIIVSLELVWHWLHCSTKRHRLQHVKPSRTMAHPSKQRFQKQRILRISRKSSANFDFFWHLKMVICFELIHPCGNGNCCFCASILWFSRDTNVQVYEHIYIYYIFINNIYNKYIYIYTLWVKRHCYTGLSGGTIFSNETQFWSIQPFVGSTRTALAYRFFPLTLL